ncbi:protein transport protein Sec31A-like [Planococcus citri]|uniref:protein transport protein Sec31A-like n=1 Tax=Planococcus citri TaxID=170843 RepID=UPI0031F95B29
MTIKEIKKTVHLAWSPKSQDPIYLVAGTAAQQLDASFSTSAAVELYKVNLGDHSKEPELKYAFKSDYRFHKLIWNDCGGLNESDKGVIVGGSDSGKLLIYSATELLKDEKIPGREDGLIASRDKHSGPVRALDFNTFQSNLLATGASSSEIFIWDLNDKKLEPMTPGAPAQPLEDVTSLSWNKQVEHILATSFATRCLVWDLRKNQTIIKLSDSSSKIRWKDVKWNPANATQLCLASEEDHYPVIQMWDLRLATSPIKTFEGHQKGVLSLAWCADDPDLLVSCGKDDKLLVWNPNTASTTGEIVHEISAGTEWNFEVNWCPRNPFLIASSSSNGIASISSLVGDDSIAQGNNKIADSFPGMNQYQQPSQPVNLGKPPKWMRKPVGVSFAFGGKLVSFGNDDKVVEVRQVVTESDLDMKFKELEKVLEQGNAYGYGYCLKKAEASDEMDVKDAWNFIAMQFHGPEFKNLMYNVLGTSDAVLQEKLSNLKITDVTKQEELSSDSFSNVSRIGPADNEDIFANLSAQQNSTVQSSPTKSPLKIIQTPDVEGAICDALLLGNIELAVELCIKENRMADAIVLAVSRGPELLAQAQAKYFEKSNNHLTTLISAVVTEDWFHVVETCDLTNWRQVLIALLTYTRDDEFRALCECLGQRLSAAGDEGLKKDALLCYIIAGNVNRLVEYWKPSRSGSPAEVQELAELGLLMKEAAKARGINVTVDGALANVLLQYAELLVSQGYLKEAYSYLGESNEESILLLKDRLMYALGLRTTGSQVPQHKSSGYFQPQQQHQVPYGDHYGNFVNPPKSVVKPFNQVNQVPPMPPTANKPPVFTPSQPTNVTRPPLAPVNAYNSTPPQIPFSYGAPAAPAAASAPSTFTFGATPPSPSTFPPQPSPFASSALPPTAPPTLPVSVFNPTPAAPPSLSNSQPIFFNPSAGLQFSNANAAAPPPPLPGAVRATPTPTPPPPPPTSQVPYTNLRKTPDHLSQNRPKHVPDPSVMPSAPHRNSFSSNFPPLPGAPPNQPPINSVPPFAAQNETSFYHPQPQQNSFYPMQPQTNSNSFVPNSHTPAPMTPLPSQQPEIPKIPLMSPPAPGWNDPPSLTFEKPVPNQVGYVTPIPITHPLYGSSIPEENIANNFPPTSNAPVKLPGGYATPNSYHNNMVAPQPGIPPMQNMENIPKPKPALPEHHIHLQTVFDELRNQCYNKTVNPQMKRKLDDVARKLEMLYDAIRESRLSEGTLQSLHGIVGAIQRGNYQECLSLHTKLVSGPDFSTIASFMPGIKMLVQSAMQLEVYL